MPTTFDGVNLLMTLPSHGGAGVQTLDAEVDLYKEWKLWMLADPQRQGFPPLFRTIGGDQLTPGIDAGAYFFIRNDYGWRVKPAEEDATIYLNGNVTPQDSSLPILIPTDGDFSVLVDGLQPITQNVDKILLATQIAEYNGTVTIDTVGGVSGTAYPVGTKSNPVSNLADAVTILTLYTFRIIELFGEITLTQAFSSFKFKAATSRDSAIIHLNGQNVNQTLFEKISMDGEGIGIIFADDCEIQTVSGVSGHFTRCPMKALFAPSGNSKTTLHQCYSDVPGQDTAIFDLADMSDADFQSRDWHGGATYSNIDVADQNVSIDCSSGNIIFDNTCIDGNAVLRGLGKFTNNGSGSFTLDSEGFLDTRIVQKLYKINNNRLKIDTTLSTLTIYDDDDVTPFIVWDLKDVAGDPALANSSFERLLQ
jgi:hypothetical protein